MSMIKFWASWRVTKSRTCSSASRTRRQSRSSCFPVILQSYLLIKSKYPKKQRIYLNSNLPSSWAA